MSAASSAKRTLSSAVDTVKFAFRNTKEFVEELTLKQALFIAAGVMVVVMVFSNLLIGFWQKYLPSMLITLVKFLIYIIVPCTAAASTVFGMWLERKYEKYDELHDSVMEKIDQMSNGVRDIKKKM